MPEAPTPQDVEQAFLAHGAEQAQGQGPLGPPVERGASLVPSPDGRFAFKLAQKPRPQGLGEDPPPAQAPPRRAPFLRGEMKPEGLEALRLQLAEAETRLTWIHGAERLAALGTAGNARRMMGDHRMAERWLEEAVTLAHEAQHGLAWALNMVRLATAIQHQERHAEALALFHQVVQLTESPGVPEAVAGVAHFARQHRGKCLAELGDWPAAREDLERALAWRKAKGDPELIASTESALDALDERQHGPWPAPPVPAEEG